MVKLMTFIFLWLDFLKKIGGFHSHVGGLGNNIKKWGILSPDGDMVCMNILIFPNIYPCKLLPPLILAYFRVILISVSTVSVASIIKFKGHNSGMTIGCWTEQTYSANLYWHTNDWTKIAIYFTTDKNWFQSKEICCNVIKSEIDSLQQRPMNIIHYSTDSHCLITSPVHWVSS